MENFYNSEEIILVHCDICNNSFTDYIKCQCWKNNKMLADKKVNVQLHSCEKTDLIIKGLKNEIDILKASVSQLIDGLYNPATQKHHLQLYQDILYQRAAPEAPAANNNHEKINEEITLILHENKYPTTRQGDDHEKRIQELEQWISKMNV